MPDVIDQLHRYADAAALAVPATEPDRIHTTRHQRRRRVLVAAVIVVAASLGVVAVDALDGSDPSAQVTTEPSTTHPSTRRPTTATTAPATRSLRTSPVVALSDGEYLVWGGEAGANDVSQRADGFAVDLTTGDVRPIPPAPIDPRSGATGVWTGSSFIVCCGAGQADGYPGDTRSAAAWDPATGEWQVLARPPASIARSFPASVWTGEVMVVVASGPAAAIYDPESDRWTEVAAPAVTGRHPEAVWTGEEVVVWDSRYGSGRVPPTGEIADQGWRWAPGQDAWEPLPPLPTGARTQLGSMAWTGSEVVVWGLSTSESIGTGARWDPGDDRWRALAPSPQGPVREPFDGTAGSQALASDDQGHVLVKGLDGTGDPVQTGGTYLYDAATDSWSTTTVAITGFHPPITLADGLVLVPDEARPVAGEVRP